MAAPSSALHSTDSLTWRARVREFGSVVCMSTADIDAPLWTNKQHVAIRLAQEVPTLYVESLGLRTPRMSRRDLARAARRLAGRRSILPRGLPSGFQVTSPLVVPYWGVPGVARLNRALLRYQLAPQIARLARPRLLLAYSPIAAWLAQSGEFDAVAYHCVDDLATQPRMPARFIRGLEVQLATAATAVFASAPALEEALLPSNPRTYLTPNVCDWEHFSQATRPGPLPAELEVIPRPRALFVGALSDYKVDWTLLGQVARCLQDWSFVFVGPPGDEQRPTGRESIAGLSNCHFLGWRPLESVPSFMRGADVGLLPYVLSEHTRSVFPLKTMEYLSAGLPVVATRLESLVLQPDLPVYLAAGAEEFAAALQTVDSSDDARLERSAFASTKTWDSLLDRILDVMTESS